MNRRYISLLALIAVLAVCGVARAQEVERSGDGWTVRKSERIPVSGSKRIVIDRIQGEVTVRGSSGSDIVVTDEIRFRDASRSTAEKEAARMAFELDRRSDSIYLEAGHSDADSYRSMVVDVPRDVVVEIDLPLGNVTVQDMRGNVSIGTGAGNVEVGEIGGTLRIRTGAGNVEADRLRGDTRIHSGGGNIDVSRAASGLDIVTGGGYVDVNSIDGDIDITTGGGDVDVKDAQGNATVYSAGGSIDAVRVRGNVQLSTSGGGIDMMTIGGNVDAGTNGGDIDGSDLRGRVDVETLAGDIDLEDVHGSVSARSEVGDVSISVAQGGLDARVTIDARASHGDIELSLPSSVKALIKADTGSDGAVTIPKSGWRMEIVDSRPGRRGTIRQGEFRINGGGAQIDLESGWGDIEIEIRR